MIKLQQIQKGDVFWDTVYIPFSETRTQFRPSADFSKWHGLTQGCAFWGLKNRNYYVTASSDNRVCSITHLKWHN